ncbi:MAG TPA: 4Fe-4S dicluster domain-containing protein [Polyangiaceae bacterium]|nr:4Fe-4S dicluster domain-containing protein [Polyangiaceae bacterium]
MKDLQDLAQRLLVDGTVAVVIGYERGPRGARPAFVQRPEDVERLIFDAECVQNLATYLSPRRRHLLKLGRKAVVAKPCDVRAIAGLVREKQVKRDEVVVIGVRCPGVGEDRCVTCTAREPRLADHLVGAAVAAPAAGESQRDAKLRELEAMTPAERWNFWQAELSRCVRCHACREICPMCQCDRCVASKTQPQWIESSPHARGNLSWQLTRVLHQAGRCVDCGECERACPEGIPLGLLLRKVAEVVDRRFDFRPSDDPELPTPIGAYRLDDPQEFIL